MHRSTRTLITFSHSLSGLCLLVVLVCSTGCAKKHRALEEISAEKSDLPTLYLTENSLKRVMAPASVGVHVDEETGEICYQPYECTNPSCPGKKGEENFLFVHRDVLLSVGPNNEIIYGTPPVGVEYAEFIKSKGGYVGPTCPKCFETRNLESETDEQRQQYQDWVQGYELPETVQRRKELDEEYQAAFEHREKVRQGG